MVKHKYLVINKYINTKQVNIVKLINYWKNWQVNISKIFNK